MALVSLFWLLTPPHVSSGQIEQQARKLGMVYRSEVLPWEEGGQDAIGDSTGNAVSAPENASTAVKQPAGPINVEITPGNSLEEIAAQLKELGILQDSVSFVRFVQDNGMSQKIRAGSYQIPAGADEGEIMKIITLQK